MNSSIEQATTDPTHTEILESGVWYVGFPGEDTFVKLVNEYIDTAKQTSNIPDKLISDTLAAFMENALNHYFVSPLETLQATNNQRKIVMMGVNTIRKAVGAVLRKVVAKMTPEDRVKLAQYMSVMVVPPNESHDVSLVIYPIEDDMARTAKQILHEGRHGDTISVKSDLQSLLISVNEEAMKAYFHIPFQMMNFGPIMRKVVKMTADATCAASQAVIKKVISGLNEEELLRIFDYVEALFVKGPPHSGPLES